MFRTSLIKLVMLMTTAFGPALALNAQVAARTGPLELVPGRFITRNRDMRLTNFGLLRNVFTTGVGCNGGRITSYHQKDEVYLYGATNNSSANVRTDGSYYVRVTDPNGALLGTSVGSINSTPVHVTSGNFDACYHLTDILIKASDHTAGYDDTSNMGGEYKVWLCLGSDFKFNQCKTDNFKVLKTAEDLFVSKTATTAFSRKITWGITKSANYTLAEIPYGGSAIFRYTVVLTHDLGTDYDWKLSGTISVQNPNPYAVSGVNISDDLAGAA